VSGPVVPEKFKLFKNLKKSFLSNFFCHCRKVLQTSKKFIILPSTFFTKPSINDMAFAAVFKLGAATLFRITKYFLKVAKYILGSPNTF
jgi:hypothetical protein